MKTFSCVNHSLQQSVLERIVELSWNGLGYKRIIDVIADEFSVKLSKGTLSNWFNKGVVLYGGQNYFEPKPSKEFAYVLGIMFGDGNLHFDKKKKDYLVRLDAIDKDFVEKFSACASIILNKTKCYSVCSVDGRGHSTIYSARTRSKELYYFIKELKYDLEKAKPFAEAHSKEFIRGLADSEGCPRIVASKKFNVGVMVACSTNKSLLIFVKNLLKNDFGILSRVYLLKKAGITDSVINGRPITRTMNLYGLDTVGFENTKLFSKSVGFFINRKQVKLKEGIEIFDNFIVSERIKRWGELYFKNKSKKWVRKLPKHKFDN
jgi:DNA endonuclease